MISQLQRRSMVVKRLKVFQIESIVRGYITGSAWSSYQENGTVCGRGLPPGLQESEKLQQPLWTPCTKAEVGGKDENISPAEAARIVGQAYADQIEQLSLELYKEANTYAAERAAAFGVLKDWLVKNGMKGKEMVEMPDDVALKSIDRYKRAYRSIVGKGWDAAEEAAA
ncbi:hypothetical protein HO133_003651 [Letharia lupina]|uniref:Phosphoribosylaminoimidazole-succinocarboxamide synthase n=1 Tax=Letharia lupina TaxID=560253 RepID=A0A8H6CAT8_9LECA|nr:uncharacterized protein HO133_003651 [Letharia lupina]KAF6219826.1 hypothetical protein HO133_003651 [Letharia lupina]